MHDYWGLLAESAVHTRGPDAAAGRPRKVTRGLALLSQQETVLHCLIVEASKLAVMADEGVLRVPAMDIQPNWQEVLRYTLTIGVVSPAVPYVPSVSLCNFAIYCISKFCTHYTMHTHTTIIQHTYIHDPH